jgi:dienelactone hydrolase
MLKSRSGRAPPKRRKQEISLSITRDGLRRLFALQEPAFELLGTEIEERDGYAVERLRFELAGRGPVRGVLTRPLQAPGPLPAILYAHAHGGRYDIGADELLDGRDALLSPPLGPVFAQEGYVTLMLDMPTFGERAAEKEWPLSKALLWYGKSLIGEMLSDQAAGLSYLCSRLDVDPGRIGAFGMSMGCTLSYWLAAVDERIAATAHLCCFADFATLIELGAHDGHGIYLTVPGLLAETSTGAIAGLVAPRPQLICVGGADTLTPPLAVDRAFAEAEAAYVGAGAGEALTLLRMPDVGHQETPEMREAVLAFFREEL